MKCPKCGVKLAESHIGDQKSVISDICPKCQGVWLDKGELDSLSSGGEGLIFEVASSAHKNLIQLMQRARLISPKHGMLAGLHVTGGGVVYDQGSQRDFLSLT